MYIFVLNAYIVQVKESIHIIYYLIMNISTPLCFKISQNDMGLNEENKVPLRQSTIEKKKQMLTSHLRGTQVCLFNLIMKFVENIVETVVVATFQLESI